MSLSITGHRQTHTDNTSRLRATKNRSGWEMFADPTKARQVCVGERLSSDISPAGPFFRSKGVHTTTMKKITTRQIIGVEFHERIVSRTRRIRSALACVITVTPWGKRCGDAV